jgi:2-keto-3-deoxy-L-rhamnonate aldolase RhmA
VLSGQPRFGVLCASGSEASLELAGAAGYDWILLDGEHGDGVDVGRMAALIRAADSYDIPVVVRVPKNDVSAIQQVLDAGAIGIVVPHVRTADDARRAVSYAKFAPAGERAMSGPGRANGYEGGGAAWAEYWRVANDETLVVAIVEHVDAVENVEEIAAVEGLDAIWIGMGDLSQDMGVAGLPPTPELLAALDRGLRAAQASAKASVMPLPAAVTTPRETRTEQVARHLEHGYTLLFALELSVLGASLRELSEGYRAAVAAHAVARG